MSTKGALGVFFAFSVPLAVWAQEPPAPSPTAEPPADAATPTVVEHDVSPELVVYSSAGVQLALGGLFQLHISPYVGNDALISDDDPAGREGFRLRRARFGAYASFPADLRLL